MVRLDGEISGPHRERSCRSGEPIWVVGNRLDAAYFETEHLPLGTQGGHRIFGPFSRDFFVPWDEITVTRADRFLQKVAKLSFGRPPAGNLTIRAEVADRIARTAGKPWPESGPFPEPTNAEALSKIVKQWAAMTALAAAFFIIVPRLLSPHRAIGPPIAVAVLFPAIVFGIGAIVQYVRRNRP
jgi:hypothetical protein